MYGKVVYRQMSRVCMLTCTLDMGTYCVWQHADKGMLDMNTY